MNENIFKEKYIKLALKEGKKGMLLYDEVPIGAVIVHKNKIIAKAYNKKEKTGLPTKHAEIVAIEKAIKKLGDWRLNDCDIYITLEPCAMCCGAIINARVGNVYFGAYDKKYGCANSIYNLLTDKKFNHNPKIIKGGILEKECVNILQNFFESKRKKCNN